MIIPKREDIKPHVKSDETGDVVVLDSDSDNEAEKVARSRMEARMRAEIEHRRLEEFESIIRRSKTPPHCNNKPRRKKAKKDPVPIVLSD